MRCGSKEEKLMDNALLMYASFAAAAGVFVLFEWLGRRRERKSRNRTA